MTRAQLIAGLVTVAACGRFGFEPDDATAPPGSGDAFNLMRDAPVGTTVVSFGEAPGTTYSGVTIDTFLSESAPQLNYGVAGAASVGAFSGDHTGLLRFELGGLPTSTSVVAAELHLRSGSTGNATITVHEVLEAWTEGAKVGQNGQASWKDRMFSTAWSVAGAGAPTSRGSTAIGSASPTGTMLDLVLTIDPTVVMRWIADPASNNGFAFVGVTTWQFITRESSTSAYRPVLVLAIL